MKIGIDISQLAYEGTGVEQYLGGLLSALLAVDSENEYVLFFSSLRGTLPEKYQKLESKNVSIFYFKIPQRVLDILWNRLHLIPIEWFMGDVDVFITSDWTEPPAIKAKKVTILYDLIVHKFPEETDRKIVTTQKRKLHWVKKESTRILCISKATKKDAKDLFTIPDKKLEVIYPGGTI